MNETEISESLKQNIPVAPEPTVATPVVGDPQIVPVSTGLGEITKYKLMQHFGENYREADPAANQQIDYIYEKIADQIGSNDYPVVVAKINELKRMLGLNHTENSRYKLYQWLKLDQKRSSIEMEMGNIRG